MKPPALSPEGIILRALTRAADNGQECPSNPALAGLFGAASSSTPVRYIQKLEKAGLILVERFGAARVVTIVATGRATRHEGARVPHFRLRSDAPAPIGSGKPKAPRANPGKATAEPRLPATTGRGEPCPLCAVRPDVGCSHNPLVSPAAAAIPSISDSPPKTAMPRPRTFEEQLAAVAAGARLVPAFHPTRPAPSMTLGGVASGML